MTQPNCIGFPPSIDAACTTLILGSMPGISSLKASQYYAHPQNRFWPLITRLLTGTDEVPPRYEDRLALLLVHHIALWDSIDTCRRDGSLDTAIRDETANDFIAFFAAFPAIHTVCFNGAKSAQTFRKNNPLRQLPGSITFHALPSTSPANARWRLDDLIREWGRIIHP